MLGTLVRFLKALFLYLLLSVCSVLLSVSLFLSATVNHHGAYHLVTSLYLPYKDCQLRHQFELCICKRKMRHPWDHWKYLEKCWASQHQKNYAYFVKFISGFAGVFCMCFVCLCYLFCLVCLGFCWVFLWVSFGFCLFVCVCESRTAASKNLDPRGIDPHRLYRHLTIEEGRVLYDTNSSV